MKRERRDVAVGHFFASDYDAARRRFVAAAGAAGAELDSLESPVTGPAGQTLTTDLGWIGPKDAGQVLVTISGTHGVEGFCGNGCQVAWLESGLAGELPAAMA